MSSSLYKFTFSGAAITAIQEFDDGIWKNERIERNEVWAYDASTNTVTKTETEHGRVKVKTYTDLDNDGVFVKALSSSSATSVSGSTFVSSLKQFDFTIAADNIVTAVRENERGVWHNERMHLNETWTYDPVTDSVTKVENEHGYLETTVYIRDLSGFFTRESETYQFGAGATSLIDDSASDDILYGYESVDRINSGDGDDYVESYGGNDILNGGNGNDYLYAGSGNDSVDGGAGDDLIVGGDGAGDDTYKGGSGIDTVKYTSATQAINVNLTSGKASGAEINNDKLYDIENVIAGDGSDSIVGSNAVNYLYGGLGNDNIDASKGDDFIFGGEGNDSLNGGLGIDIADGGLGNDLYFVDNSRDVVRELFGEGVDSVRSSVSYTLSDNVENLTLINNASINAVGNGLNNTLIGNNAVNNINGGDGDDVINGGLGKDILTGGNGSDYFVFNTVASASNTDRVTDFQDGIDKLQLEDSIFTKIRGDLNLSDNIVNGTKALDANDYLVYNNTNGVLYYDLDGSGRAAAVAIATIGTGHIIDTSDFFII